MTGVRGILTMLSRAFWSNRAVRIVHSSWSWIEPSRRLGMVSDRGLVPALVRHDHPLEGRAIARVATERDRVPLSRCLTSTRMRGVPR